MSMTLERGTGIGLHKGAILLASLGPELAARVLSHLGDRHVEALVSEMTRLGHVPATQRDTVVDEFRLRLSTDSGATGGMDYARRMLESALGAERANQMLMGLSGEEPPPPPLEELIAKTPPASLAALVADEHPQLIALLAGQLSVEKAAPFLAALPVELQGPVAARLTEMEAPAPIALQHLQRCLLEKLRGESGGGDNAAQNFGPRRVADILGQMRRSVEEKILNTLESQAPALAVKVKQFRLTFDNLLELDGKSLQRLLREVEADTLRLAMKGLDEDRQRAIYQNMSERASARLREDLENTGPTRLSEVETAQATIVGIARRLQEQGELQLSTGASTGEEEALV